MSQCLEQEKEHRLVVHHGSHRSHMLLIVSQQFAKELHKRLSIITSFIAARIRASDVSREFHRRRLANELRDGNPSSKSGLVPTRGPKQIEKNNPYRFVSISFSFCLCVSVRFPFLTRVAWTGIRVHQQRVSLPVVSTVKRRTCSMKLIDLRLDNVTPCRIPVSPGITLSSTIGVNVTPIFLLGHLWSNELII